MNDNTPVYIYDLNLELSKLQEQIIQNKMTQDNINNQTGITLDENIPEIKNKINELQTQVSKIRMSVESFIRESLILYGSNNYHINRQTMSNLLQAHITYYVDDYYLPYPHYADIDEFNSFINDTLIIYFEEHSEFPDYFEAIDCVLSYCQSKKVSPFTLTNEDMEGLYEQWKNDHADEETEQT